jgi:hypothetical protein
MSAWVPPPNATLDYGSMLAEISRIELAAVTLLR